MRSTTILICMVIFLVVFSCNKEEKPRQPEPIVASMFGFMFDPGSNWIYFDSFSTKSDSMYISHNNFRNQQHGGGAGSSFVILQEYYMQYRNFFGKDSVWVTVAINRLWFELPGYLWYSTDTNLNAPTWAHFRYVELKPSLRVAGNEYKNVKVTEYDNEDHFNGDFNRYYFKDSIGVIRCERFDNYVMTRKWDLKRFALKYHKL